MSQPIEHDIPLPGFERSWDKTDIALSLGRVALDFADVKRVPRKADGERESDVEHSFMLGLIAPELIEKLELGLDKGLVAQFANVHDLIELRTGDVNTFSISAEDYKKKAEAEALALEELINDLPPYTAQLLERYESQAEPEARFVKAVDKFLPFIVDMHGEGIRIMMEDHNILSGEAYLAACEGIQKSFEDRFGDEFPELAVIHRELWQSFGQKFRRLVPRGVEQLPVPAQATVLRMSS